MKREFWVFGKPNLVSQFYKAGEQAGTKARMIEATENPSLSGELGKAKTTAFTVGLLTPAVALISNPFQFAKGIFYSVTHPRATAQFIGAGLKTTPEATGGELIGSGALFSGLQFGLVKGIDIIKTTGRQYIPIEKIAPPEGIAGKFPTFKGSNAEMVKEFYTSKYTELFKKSPVEAGGFHTTEGNVKISEGVSSAIPKRPTDTPGLYIAPSASPNFLRLTKSYYNDVISFKPEFLKNPKIYYAQVSEGVTRFPSNIRQSLPAMQKYISETAKGSGKAFISGARETGMKIEAEAVISPESSLSILSKRFYTKFEGRRVLIDEITAGKQTSKNMAKDITQENFLKMSAKGQRDIYSSGVGISPVTFAGILSIPRFNAQSATLQAPNMAYDYSIATSGKPYTYSSLVTKPMPSSLPSYSQMSNKPSILSSPSVTSKSTTITTPRKITTNIYKISSRTYASSIISSSISIPSNSIITTPPVIPSPFKSYNMGAGVGDFGFKRTSRKGKRKFRYTPQLFAQALNIYSTKQQKRLAERTGLSVRGL